MAWDPEILKNVPLFAEITDRLGRGRLIYTGKA
jgi:hypothetical protein